MWQDYFKLVKLVPGKVVIPKFGTVDFSNPKLSVDLCRRIYEADFHILKITEKGKCDLYGIKSKSKSYRKKNKNHQ